PSIRYLTAIDTPFPRHISATSSPQIRYPTSTYTPPQRHKYASQLHPYTPFCPYMSAHMHRNYIRICTATCTAIHSYTRNPSANNAHTSPPTKRAYDPSYAAQSIRHRTPTTVNIVRFIVLAATPAD